MLIQLSVRDFAIVETAELEFDTGMTVLTGETGAGKSILVDALSLALGARASAETVRSGAQRADVTAVFEITENAAAKHWLRDHDLEEEDGNCWLRRTVTVEGRSKAYINGRPIPVGSARELGATLVDIHGQHEHQSLLRAEVQRKLIDTYGGHRKLLEATNDAVTAWHAVNDELEQLTGPSGDRAARLSLLRYQLDELEAFNPQPNEIEHLEHELRRLSNISTLVETCQRLLHQLTGDQPGNALEALQTAGRELDDLPDDDPRLLAATEMLASSGIQLQEAVADLRDYAESLEADPVRVMDVEARLSAAHDLARKHKSTPENLSELCEALRRDIENLATSESRVNELEQELKAALTRYQTSAHQLHQARCKTASKLSAAVTAELSELGMPGSLLNVQVSTDDATTPRPEGQDHVEIQIMTNPGQPVLPLARVASGGELSRISLAIQVVTVGGTGIPTVVFDEVDVGVGGRVAETVGRHMHSLSAHHQVLCVTHLPQVASQAHAHVQVLKQTGRRKVHTFFEHLAGDDRVEEIARMLGGLDITAQTRAHAREMLSKT